jgi:hypothetical protein
MSGFDADLAELALICEHMKVICDRIIDLVDERVAVREWDVEMQQQLETMARVHQVLDR